jgi:hypothetical protein
VDTYCVGEGRRKLLYSSWYIQEMTTLSFPFLFLHKVMAGWLECGKRLCLYFEMIFKLNRENLPAF